MPALVNSGISPQWQTPVSHLSQKDREAVFREAFLLQFGDMFASEVDIDPTVNPQRGFMIGDERL